MQLSFIKVHGSENDFFILDEALLERPLSEKELIEATKGLTDRKTGLLNGADGVLLVGKSQHSTAHGRMRVINSDGSEASMCGNGLRTVGRYLSEKLGQENLIVETMLADLQVKKAKDIAANVKTFQVEISPVHFETDRLPFHFNGVETFVDQEMPEFAEGLRFSTVAVPNPHLISFVEHKILAGNLLEKLAVYLNGENPYFPDGVNVSFVEVLDKQKIFVRTFERGVGFTNACGTAMAASSLMYVLLKKGKKDETIQVLNPGGMVETLVHQSAKNGSYWMELIGNATFLSKITISLDEVLNKRFENAAVSELNENDHYQKFVEKIEIR